MVEATGTPQEQNENVDEIWLIEMIGTLEEIFYQTVIAHQLSIARNVGIIIKVLSRTSRDKFFQL